MRPVVTGADAGGLPARKRARFELDHELVRRGDGGAGPQALCRGRDDRSRNQNVLAQQISCGAADLGAGFTRLGNGDVVFVQAHWILAHSRMGGGGIHDGQYSFDATQLEIGDGLDAELRSLISVPVEQVPPGWHRVLEGLGC